ncbi:MULTISPECIES: ABC transporter substrate-binding protein [unclassified Rothia (in: high G+C Gram-positive bacteria)]|uniref:ABC transporter substrate-binding protein n=1 Tax=unclassified Rothia (in: high G+C Gram-positive bacteria) TaxID=2689056 RepID=UPI00195ECC34|nr:MULTISPECIES: ABC transporter substrate-binding protein [unclassified Rothia (in: high G+C Gram-positive bacteria)]MBM7051537.1 ABC transporter substrate-binding protein [Rothia sp. ZJ1223]QRZ61316.1 ABC transporter substrate-binding protein [Rothia sp. ZJ932]
MVTISRNTFLKAAAATVASTLFAGCSTGSTGGAPSSAEKTEGGSYTIKHAYGETTFDAVPQKIAIVQNWQNPDAVLALGVVPVGAPLVTWGNNENNSTPWFDAKLAELGGEEPTRYDETDGPNYTELAKLAPDAIFTPYGDMSQEIYNKLSAIAPVVPAPEGVGPWAASWQQTVEMAGKMLRKENEAAKLIEDTEKALIQKAAEYENFKGATFIAGAFDLEQNTFGAYTSIDARPRFFSLMGMELAPYIKENEGSADSFFVNVSAEVMDQVEADVVWAWVNTEDEIEKVKSNDLFAQMPAIKNDAVVFEADKTFGLALSATSPLSLMWAVNETDVLDRMSKAIKNTRNAS